MPVNKVASYNKVNEAISELIQDLEREPSAEEIAQKLQIPIKNVENVIQATKKHISFDAPISEEDDSASLIDMMIQEQEILPDEQIISQSLSEEMQNGLSTLSPREYEIIARFYGLDGRTVESVDEIGANFNLSRERVRQIRDKSIRRLKRAYTHQFLRPKK